MKNVNEFSTTDKVPASWKPMLELAAREVFEIMLGCKLESQEITATGVSDFTATSTNWQLSRFGDRGNWFLCGSNAGRSCVHEGWQLSNVREWEAGDERR